MTDDTTPDPAHILIAAIIKSMAEPHAQPPSRVGIDVADVRCALSSSKCVAFGQAEATGKNRAIIAAEGAIRDLKRNLKAGLFEVDFPIGKD